MNAPKHTPGPWGVEQTSTRNWVGPMRQDGIKVAAVVCCTDREGLKAESIERNDADARLIAASPELLDALKLTIPYIEQELDAYKPTHEGPCGPWAPCDGNCMATAYISETLHKVKTAIAKAE